MARFRGRPDPGPVDVARMLPVAYTVALVLVAMSVIILWADIVKADPPGVGRGFGESGFRRCASATKSRPRNRWSWVHPLESGTSVGVPTVRATPTPVPKSNACA